MRSGPAEGNGGEFLRGYGNRRQIKVADQKQFQRSFKNQRGIGLRQHVMLQLAPRLLINQKMQPVGKQL